MAIENNYTDGCATFNPVQNGVNNFLISLNVWKFSALEWIKVY